MKIEKFEDLIVWQKARVLNKLIYEVTSLKKFSNDFALTNQIRRSSISVISNIAEGFERNGNKEFIQFLYISKASCAELRSQLYIALDLEYLSIEKFDEINSLAIEVSKMTRGLIQSIENSSLKGSKYKT